MRRGRGARKRTAEEAKRRLRSPKVCRGARCAHILGQNALMQPLGGRWVLASPGRKHPGIAALPKCPRPVQGAELPPFQTPSAASGDLRSPSGSELRGVCKCSSCVGTSLGTPDKEQRSLGGVALERSPKGTTPRGDSEDGSAWVHPPLGASTTAHEPRGKLIYVNYCNLRAFFSPPRGEKAFNSRAKLLARAE